MANPLSLECVTGPSRQPGQGGGARAGVVFPFFPLRPAPSPSALLRGTTHVFSDRVLEEHILTRSTPVTCCIGVCPLQINERIFGCSGFPADSHDIIWQTYVLISPALASLPSV